MITLGIILIILGFIGVGSWLYTLGAILLVLGIILNLVPIGGSTRRVW